MLELAPGAYPSHLRVDRVTPSAHRAPSGNVANVPAGALVPANVAVASCAACRGRCRGGTWQATRTSLSSTGSPPCTDARRPEESRPLGVPVGAPTGTLPPGVPREALPFLADTMGRTRLRPDERWGASRGQMNGRSLLRRRQTDLFHHRRRIPIIGLAADLSGLQLEDARAPHR